jgi:quinol monooxygenase YgiN
MTVLVTLEAPVKSASVADLPRLLRELLPSTRAFAGCRLVSGYLSEDGRNLLLVEEWESKDAHEKYGAWRVTTDHGKQLMAMFEGPPIIRYFGPLDV